MKIVFLDTEFPEQEFFAASLGDHELAFLDELSEVPSDTELLSIFINSEISASFLAIHPALKLIATRSAAIDHLDLEACRHHGVLVSTVPTFGETTVAEHTFALILALSRRLREAMLKPKRGKFTYEAARGFDLAGKTLGIVGMGQIGERVATLAKAFQMHVLAYDVEARPELARSLQFSFVSLDELLASSHILTLHAPLLPATHHLLNRAAFAKCRPGVIVINTARGRLIDTDALREALESGQVSGAGLDVLEDERVMRQPVAGIIAAEIVEHLQSDAPVEGAREPDRVRNLHDLMLSDALLARPNVVFTPHTAFNSIEAVERLLQGTLENIQAFAAGRPQNIVA